MINDGRIQEPLMGRKRKMLWTESQIQQFLEQRTTPNNTPSFQINIHTANQQRQKIQTFEQRQISAKATLMKHSIGRKEKKQ
jgi:hypothetical protein